MAHPAPHAEVVGAPLEQGHAQVVRRVDGPRLVQDRAQGGHVLPQQLLLEGDGVRGDDDALAVAEGVERRRDEVGERLAHARARLDQPLPAVGEGERCGLRHLQLLRALLEARQDARRRRERAPRLARGHGDGRLRSGKRLRRIPSIGQRGRDERAVGDLAAGDLPRQVGLVEGHDARQPQTLVVG